MSSALAVDSDKEDVTAGRIGALPFIAIVAQLGVLALVLRQFQIESGAFLRLLVLAFGGFAVHALLPIRFRLAFFLGLSLGGIALVLGVVNGIWLVAIGLVLIGICHLPIPFAGRVALLLAVGAALALQRASWLPAPWSLKEFLPGEDPAELTESTPLITGGILDSLATMKLVTFLEQQFGFTMQAHETDADHLDTIALIEGLLKAKGARPR